MKRVFMFSLAVILILALLAIACSAPDRDVHLNPDQDDINGAVPGDEDDGEEDANAGDAGPDQDGDNGTETTAPAGDKPAGGQETGVVRLTLYFVNTAAVANNTPGATGFLTPVTRELPYTPAVLRLALQELIRGPLPADGAVGRTLPVTTRILDLSIENGTALINFSPEVLTDPGSPGGSFAGALFIQSIVYTATQFSTVERVLVQVKGEAWSDGHFIWDEPLSRSTIP
ncbi:MAG: GerMN domain-containing protein [Bacillota bacterium]